ncbi:MAG: 30S ribosomal protein S20 [Bacilli bacterium]
MPNIKSQIKRSATNEKARNRNSAFKSRVKSAIKRVELAVVAKDKEAANVALVEAVSLLDKAVGRGIYHANKVANKKSSLQSAVNVIE